MEDVEAANGQQFFCHAGKGDKHNSRLPFANRCLAGFAQVGWVVSVKNGMNETTENVL